MQLTFANLLRHGRNGDVLYTEQTPNAVTATAGRLGVKVTTKKLVTVDPQTGTSKLLTEVTVLKAIQTKQAEQPTPQE